MSLTFNSFLTHKLCSEVSSNWLASHKLCNSRTLISINT